MTAQAIESSGPERRGASPGILAVLWLVATAALFALVANQPQRPWAHRIQSEVVLGGEHYRLDAAQVEWLEAFSRLHFGEGRESARALLEAELGSGLDEVFAPVRARLPAFADWYYSLGGEYSRLGMAALAQLNLADGEYLAGKATSLLFPAREWETALAGLDARMLVTLQVHQQRVSAAWLAELGARLAPYRVPAPLAAATDEGRGVPLQLDGFIARWVADEREAFRGRVQLSTAAGGGAAGTVLWRRAAARATAASGRVVAARGASRSAARAGAYASGGFAACGATGPAAAGCALLAGAVAWVATDWALLRLEEARNRDDLLAALDAGLTQLQAQMLAEALAAYDQLTVEQEALAEGAFEREFRPAQAGR